MEIIFISLSVYLLDNNPPVTTLMKSREIFSNYPTQPLTCLKLEQVPSLIKKITVQIEDPGFYHHNGIHIWGMYKALITNIKKGYSYAGGSTITQQLGKSLFLYQKKSIIRKLLDIQLAVTLDSILSKERIYELYFNYIEFGPGVYGLYNGSLYHFNKRPEQLSQEQAIILITLISSPLNYNKHTYKQNRLLRIRYRHIKKFITRENL